MKKLEIYPRPIGDVTTEAYLDIGNYVNNHRHMAEVKDGCKVSYRRLIYAALQFPKGKLVPATNLIASVANYHPHSLTGIEGLNATLVNSGVFTGEGSFGFTSITGTENPPAAPRYLKNRLEEQDIKVEVSFLSIDDKIDFKEYDLFYLGSGSEENQLLVLNDFNLSTKPSSFINIVYP